METAKNIDAWRVLVALESGLGFKQASIETNIDLSVCFRLIQKLSEELDCPLIEKKVRPSKLTKEGLLLVPSAKQLLRQYDKIITVCQNLGSSPMSVRFSVPVNSPRKSVFSHLRKYQKIDPNFEILTVSDKDHISLLKGQIDVAFLPYRPEDDDLIIWDVGTQTTALLATREYLRKYGTPTSPEDLKNHKVILRKAPIYPLTTELIKEDKAVKFEYDECVFAGDVLNGKEALMTNLGISVDLSLSSLREELNSGMLKVVLPGWHRPVWNLSVAIRKTDVSNSRLTAFARWFAKEEAASLMKRKLDEGSAVGLAPYTY